MKHILAATLTAIAASAALSAQTAPTLLTAHAPSTVFDINNPVLAPLGTAVNTAALFKLANNGPGEWTVGMTINTGTDRDIHLATWSPNPGGTPVLTLTNEAAALNDPTSYEYLLQIEPSQGQYAVFDRFVPNTWAFLGVFIANRSGPGAPFQAPVQIQNLQGANAWGDPSVGYVDGQLMLFYGGNAINPAGNVGPAILMAPIDLTNPAGPTAGAPLPVSWPVAGGTPHSPTPIIGADGDVEGLWLGEYLGGDSDAYFADDLDPNTPAQIVFDTTAWLNGGGIAGGNLLMGDDSAGYAQLREARGAWLVGDAEPMVTGGIQVDARTGSPHGGNNVPNITFLFGSDTLLPTPVPAPGGILGDIGIGGTLETLSILVPGIAADETSDWSLQVPYIPSLVGAVFHIQGLALQPATGVGMLTNTAKLVL